jgi:uncharacterized protein
MLGYHYWERVFEAKGSAENRRFVSWAAKGLIAPVALWLVINTGIVPGMPILVREVAMAKDQGAGWSHALWRSVWAALALVSSYWCALTFCWLAAVLVPRVEDRSQFAKISLIWTLILLPFSGLLLFLVGLKGLGAAGMIVLVPLVHLNLALSVPQPKFVSYAPALAKLKFGKYRDAERDIIKELEKCEDDYTGWLMLAELYARQFHDLNEADRTVRELCAQPNIDGVQVSLALNRLADWHLSLADDPVSARAALEEIVRVMPGTHNAHMAEQRIAQLPSSAEELREQRKPRVYRLPALGDALEEADVERTESDLLDARLQADRCVAKLKENPNHVAAREEFAVLLAHRLGRAEVAIDQLRLLVNMPDQPVAKVADWLATMAAWHLKYRRDEAAARPILDRLIQQFPGTTQALAARRRLELMETEKLVQAAPPAPPKTIKLVQRQN